MDLSNARFNFIILIGCVKSVLDGTPDSDPARSAVVLTAGSSILENAATPEGVENDAAGTAAVPAGSETGVPLSRSTFRTPSQCL